MSDSVVSAIAHLQQSTANLNTLADLAATRVKQLEDYLESCGIGFEVSIAITEAEKPDLYFSYSRIAKKYRLAVQQPGLMASPVAWAECSRDLKIRTIQHLPRLLHAITKQIDERVKEAKAAAASVANVLSTLDIPRYPKTALEALALAGLSTGEPSALEQVGIASLSLTKLAAKEGK